MSFVLLGILNSQAAAGGGIRYFLARPDAGTVQTEDVAFDANNIYIAQNTDTVVVRDTNTLELVWGKSIVWNSSGIDLDSTGNIYASHDRSNDLGKFDSSGTLVWQKELPASIELYDLKIDANDNIYTVGVTQESPNEGSDDFLLTKLDTSGNVVWARSAGRGSNDIGYGLAFDSSQNIYGAGTYRVTSGYRCMAIKYNPSGVHQWDRYFARNANMFFYDAAVDSNDDVYFTGYMPDNSVRGYLVKMSDTSSVLWQRQIGQDGVVMQGCAVDSADNVYIVGNATNAGLIAKYDSSGTLVWQRTLSNSSFATFNRIRIDENDDLLIVGQFRNAVNQNRGFICRLPSDGSLTGTYTLDGQIHTYAASSLSTGTTNVSNTGNEWDKNTQSLSTTNTSFTESTVTPTIELTEL